MKFIGHLDMMRYFQKAVRRAKIDIRYSEGYSPHQIMSFAAPLGVGITSDGEYFDIEVNESMTSKEAVAALNETMVDGVEVTSYVKLPDKAKTAMSIVAAADYRLSYKEGYESPFSTEEWKRIVKERFLDSPQFTIIKKTKKSEREVDLKPLVYAFSVEEEQGRPAFFLQVSTGSVDNIKPELVLSSVYQLCGLEYCESAIQIHRLGESATAGLLSLHPKSHDGEHFPCLLGQIQMVIFIAGHEHSLGAGQFRADVIVVDQFIEFHCCHTVLQSQSISFCVTRRS